MNLDDLWIGDIVTLKKSGRRGVYEGYTDKGKAKVSVNGKTILSNSSNVELYKEEKKAEPVNLHEEATSPTKKLDFKDEIDLHMEVLDPNIVNHVPQRILDKQIQMCRSFIEQAIQSRKYKITIIHGIGVGQLRKEVEHLLGDYPEAQRTELVNNGGATVVTFHFY